MSIDAPSTAMRKVPGGFSSVDLRAVHAVGIGDERLAEEGPADARQELELEEVVRAACATRRRR